MSIIYFQVKLQSYFGIPDLSFDEKACGFSVHLRHGLIDSISSLIFRAISLSGDRWARAALK